MSEQVARILDDALRLPAIDRAAVVERLLSSLERPDPDLEDLWAKEADHRIALYEAGQMVAYDAEDVFRELDEADD